MRNTWLKVIVSTSAVVVIICIVLVIYVMKPIILKNDINESERIETTKYNYESKLEDLHLEKEEDYLEYLLEIKRRVKPQELQKLVIVDNNRAARYKASYFQQKEEGNQILIKLTAGAYRELLCRVIRHGEDWSELPLTKHFREKFKPESGVILEKDYIYHEGFHTYVGQFKYSDKLFSVSAESKEKGNYRKWYKFILDEEGYLDDVIFDHDEIVPLVPEWG